ncbi:MULTISPECIES: glycosyltransferase [Achromobacter]|uniref:glycosyltransferase n=1 Tax=Achromobacter TaxID=222 RepID=UPI001F447E1C|nr:MULTISPECIES: glycosyltransferase [Achromobacter]MCH1989827.1 glycosyltransferase [Achromobacter xylosoxidans]MCH4586302.1 glycosyltransferase [Achromobacter xylosoxidans]
MMKILYTNFHVGPNVSGHAIYISRLATNLAGSHSISVAAPRGCALLRLAADIPNVSTYPIEFSSRLYRMPAPARKLRALLERENFDVVHVNGSADHKLVILASLFLKQRPKIVFTKHNDQPISALSARIRTWLGTDHVIAVCDHVRRKLAKTAYANAGISTVFNGVDTTTFRPSSAEEKSGMRARYFGKELAGRIVLGSNAGTGEYKSWMDMVRAVARLPLAVREGFHVAVAGGPISSADLAEIRGLGMEGRFSYVGILDDVRPFISAIDVGFVLSHRVETISFACREMMACGKPVIVTEYAGLPENITRGIDGWVVPPRFPDSIATLLTQIADQAFNLFDMGVAARRKAEAKFDQVDFIHGTQRVYVELVFPAPRRHELSGAGG